MPGSDDGGGNNPFAERLGKTAHLSRLAVRLVWLVSPGLALGIVALVVAEAVLGPLQLALSKLVVDRVALDLGLLDTSGGLVSRLPLAVWALLAAIVLAAGQLIQPSSASSMIRHTG